MRKIVTLVIATGLFFGSVSGVWAASAPSVVPVVQGSGIDYELPYPGMLPDSPFYFVKTIRDQVVGFLIQSQVNKAFYELLLADKNLASGKILIDEGKKEIGTAAVVSGEENFTQAVDRAEDAKKGGSDISDLSAKLAVSGAKHDEIISQMLTKVSEKEFKQLQKAYSDNQKSRSRVQHLLKSS